MNKIEDLLVKFLWNGHKVKIPLKVLQTTKKSGGLNLVNLQKKDMAIKATWIDILKSDVKLKNLVQQQIKLNLERDAWCCNLKEEDISHLLSIIDDIFWRDVLTAWYKSMPNDLKQEDFLWFNSEIRIENSPVFWLHHYKKGLKTISQLYTEGRLKPYQQLWAEYGLTLMQVNSFITAIPKHFKSDYKDIEINNQEIVAPTNKIAV